MHSLIVAWGIIKRFRAATWFLFIGSFAPFIDELVQYLDKKTHSIPENIGLFFVFIFCLFPAISLIVSARNFENYQSGLRKGRISVIKEWVVSVHGQSAAIKAIAELMDISTIIRREAPAKTAMKDLLISTRKIIISTFDELGGEQENQLTVSIGLPNSTRTMMKIVEMMPEGGERRKGSEYQIHPDPDHQHSMIRAFTQGIMVSTPDTSLIPELAGKSYKSVLSFPIRDMNNRLLGVLNIDGLETGMFGDRQGDGAEISAPKVAFELSQTNLLSIATVLTRAELYKDYTNS
jgi:hypothetical protein